MRHISELIREWLKKHPSLFIVAFSFFTFPASASAITPPSGLPHSLPAIKGSYTYDSAFVITSNVSCNAHRAIYQVSSELSNDPVGSNAIGYDSVYRPTVYYGGSGNHIAVVNSIDDGSGNCYWPDWDNPVPSNTINQITQSGVTGTSTPAGVYYTNVIPLSSYDFYWRSYSTFTLPPSQWHSSWVANYPTPSSVHDGLLLRSANVLPPVPENDTIDNPLSGDHKPAGSYTFSGQCTHPGLHYALNWRDWNYPTTPTITCQSDYTWSATYDIQPSGGGGRTYYLYNYETGESVSVDVIGYDALSADWSVSVDYPKLDDNSYAKVETNASFPIRIKYVVPEVDRTTTTLMLEKFSDSTYTTNTSTLLNNSLDFYDELKTGFVDSTLNISTGLQYYKVSIINSSTSTVQFAHSFKIEGVVGDPTAQSPVLPDRQDLGFFGNLFRDMFVPRPGFMNAQFEAMHQVAELHFPLYFQLRGIVDGSTSQSTVVTLGSLHFSGGSTVPITFFNPASLNPDNFSSLRSLLAMMMYVWLMYFALHKVSKIFSA